MVKVGLTAPSQKAVVESDDPCKEHAIGTGTKLPVIGLVEQALSAYSIPEKPLVAHTTLAFRRKLPVVFEGTHWDPTPMTVNATPTHDVVPPNMLYPLKVFGIVGIVSHDVRELPVLASTHAELDEQLYEPMAP